MEHMRGMLGALYNVLNKVVGLASVSFFHSPDFPLISFAFKFRAFIKVNVRIEFEGW